MRLTITSAWSRPRPREEQAQKAPLQSTSIGLPVVKWAAALIGIHMDYFASNSRDIANTSKVTDTHANQSPRNR
jgi:hypothetical protein